MGDAADQLREQEETQRERFERLYEMAREIPGGYGEIMDALAEVARMFLTVDETIDRAEALIASHRTTHYLYRALQELGVTAVDTVPEHARAFMLERANALWEEDQ